MFDKNLKLAPFIINYIAIFDRLLNYKVSILKKLFHCNKILFFSDGNDI